MSTLLEQASLIMIPSGYKEDVVYSVIPENGNGDLSFTRASDGTRINSAGLVEVCPWNLVQQSETIGTSPWLTNGATLTSGQTDPNGGTTAIKVQLASGGNNYVYQGIPLTNPINIVSAYLRADSATTIGFSMGGSTANAVNLTTTWQLFTFSSTDTSGGIIFDNYFGPSPTQQAKTFYIWHPQLNIGSTAKPYFPTTDRLNVPRLTYQNGGGGCPSLLLEKQSTNLFSYSEQLDNAYWTPLQLTVTANNTTSPDGTQNADKFTEDAVSGVHLFYNNSSVTSASTSTASIFYKKGTRRYFAIKLQIGSNSYTQVFDADGLTTGSNSSNGLTSVSTSIVSMGNGWVRASVTGTDPSASTACYIICSLSNSATPTFDSGNFNPSYLGSSSEYGFFYGAQMEASSYPTSYIPTTSASATRVADVCTKSGIGALIGGTSGTVFFDIKTNPVLSSANYKQFCYYFTSGGAQSYMYLDSNNLITTNINWGSLFFSATPFVANTRYKVALVYAPNDFALYVNGVSVATASSGTPLNNVDMQIGQINGSEMCEFVFNQYTHFPSRLTNAELATLTTI